jgi:Recombinase zinc beta ribbon domain/Recombinase
MENITALWETAFHPMQAKGKTDSSEWIIHENHHPAMIDRETFDAVQERMSERKHITTPHKNGGKFLFTGLVYCGKCGCSMTGKKYFGGVYYCNGYIHKGQCDRNTAGQNELLETIIRAIRERFFKGNTLQKLKDSIRRQIETDTPKVDADKLRKELTKLDTKLDKARRRLVEVDSDMLGEVQSHLRGLREQRERLEATLKQAGTPRRERSILSSLAYFAWRRRLSKATPPRFGKCCVVPWNASTCGANPIRATNAMFIDSEWRDSFKRRESQ